MSQSTPSIWGLLWRGVLMGLAEVVPGVSGGTMALVTGIYRQLVEAIATFGMRSFALLRSPKQFIAQHKITFLVPLGLGMLLGIVSFASLMGFLLEHYAPMVWAFFFGVILATAISVGRERSIKHLLLFGATGAAAALLVLLIPVSSGEATPLQYFIGGAIAICAWILPAVSGSYMLLVMGLYQSVIEAIRNLDFSVLLLFALGCLVGITSFVRLLEWLLARYFEALMSFLCGFMLLSALNLWPWKLADQGWFLGIVTPDRYVEVLGEPSYALGSVVLFIVGGLFIWVLNKSPE